MADTRTETRASYALQYNNGTPIPLKDFSGLLTTSQIEVSDTATVLKRQRIYSSNFMK